MERNKELENQLESVSKVVDKLIRKMAKKLKLTDEEKRERIKADFDYVRKVSHLITSTQYVFWAYEWLADENQLPATTECVKNCLKELSATLSETLAGRG